MGTTWPAGVLAGHWSDHDTRTGCSVIIFPEPVLATLDIRGGAASVRASGLLGEGRLTQHLHAIVLSGGSGFGLATADGAIRWLAERGYGIETTAGQIPIVSAAVIFDAGSSLLTAPTADAGQAACAAAGPLGEMERGRVGVGTGATWGKIRGTSAQRGGIGLAQETWRRGTVTAIVAVNAYGMVGDQPSSELLRSFARGQVSGATLSQATGESTTLAVVSVDTPADQDALARCAIAAHDGFARAIRPCHTIYDGDLVFAVAMAQGQLCTTDRARLAVATEIAVEQAILDAITA